MNMNDRRVRKTKKALQNALAEIMAYNEYFTLGELPIFI